MTIEESLLQAIKKDDIKAFDALMERTQGGAYRLGRFPLLSLLYLYKSRKILSEHEERFLKVTSFEELKEPIELSKKFSSKAGKCLRLYLSEIVSPIEMLLILDRSNHLKKVFPMTKPSSAVKGRLRSIYYIKYSLGMKFVGDDIILDKRPFTYREKKRIATICLCAVLALVIAIGVPVTTVSLMPKHIDGEVTKLSHIDFESDNVYTLKKDIVIPENFSVAKVNCAIVGEGNKLTFEKGAKFGEFNGKMSDLTIESSGEPIITSVFENATIENIVVNVNADITATDGTAFVAMNNYGTIDGVTVNVSGKMIATSTSNEDSFGGLVQNNNYKDNLATQTRYRGVIKNCAVNYSNLNLVGAASANASFGGVAGINNGYLQDCKVTGEIVADTFDIAGICSVNNGALSGNVNEANLSQTSADSGWNPIACGIVITNAYAVENCENKGNISAKSNCEQIDEQEGAASASGIAYLNRSSSVTPYIKNSANSGNVNCQAYNRLTYAAGVCISSSGAIESCKNLGDVSVKSGNGYDAYAGGITSLTYGDIYKAENNGSISAIGSGEAYIGGISAYSCSWISNCKSSGDIKVTADKVYAGGIFGFGDVISNGYYVYWGAADSCISENTIGVSMIGDTPAYVGGIVGYIKEQGFEQLVYGDDGRPIIGEDGNYQRETIYLGGCVSDCYFIGKYASEVAYFGNIVGVCGANLYQSNSYTSGGTEYHNFEGNYYLTNSHKAFGATVTDDGDYASVEDKGATSATIEDIRNLEKYKSID